MKTIVVTITMAAIVLTGCVRELSSYERQLQWEENQPKSWAGKTGQKGRDFQMWQFRKRCETAYSYECLELDIHGDRSVREAPPPPARTGNKRIYSICDGGVCVTEKICYDLVNGTEECVRE